MTSIDTSSFTALELELLDSIYSSMNSHLYANSTFLAERLLAEKDSEETRAVLAECYLRENKWYKLVDLLKFCSSGTCRYLLAMAYFKLNKLKEAQQALTHIRPPRNSISESSTFIQSVMANGAAGHFLLGRIFEKSNRTHEAIESYMNALTNDPSLWIAYEKICKLYKRKDENFLQLFPVFDRLQGFQGKGTASNIFEAILTGKSGKTGAAPQQAQGSFSAQPFNVTTPEITKNKGKSDFGMGSSSKLASGNPYSLQMGQSGSSVKSLSQNISTPVTKKSPSLYGRPAHVSGSQGTKNMGTSSGMDQEGSWKIGYEAHVSSPAFGIGVTTPQTRGIGAEHQKMGASSASEMIQENQAREKNELKTLGDLLKRLAEPVYRMSCFHPQKAIELFLRLPENHLYTGWGLFNVGSCYMDLVKYEEAEKYYNEGHRIEPYRLEGLELYSSCLWSLKKTVECTMLAYKALERSIYAPETWVTLGNVFSMQKEHDVAIKFFSRAIQLDPSFAYAYTLKGHEHMYMEDWTNAKECYEGALNYDSKNFNAYWGIGNVYLKQEKHDKAAENFKKGIEINDKCPVLFTYLGLAYGRMKGKTNDALKCFGHSERLDPSNMVNPYQKALLLNSLGRNEEAKSVLLELERKVPREAPILWLLGNVYKKLEDLPNAHRCYNIAADLEKDSQKAKGCIDALFSNGEFNEYDF